MGTDATIKGAIVVRRLALSTRNIKLLIFWSILTFAALIRFWRLGEPNTLIFDEIYYVDGARDLLSYGVEVKVDGQRVSPEFVVHPPVGKWLIALFLQLLGDNSFAWRSASALAGLACVFLIYKISIELFSSEAIALLAAVLLAIDGLAIVLSRTALLDNLLTFFVLTSFYFLIKKQIWLMAVFIGLAIATKWSGLYFLVAFILYMSATSVHSDRKNLLKIIPATLFSIFIYTASWIGWLLSKDGWDRDSSTNPLLALWNYHREIYSFHLTLTSSHPYQSSPFGWLLMARPTSFFYESPDTCGAEKCSQEILALGNPLLWWLGFFAIFALAGYWLARRDRASSLILLGLFAGYIPWFFYGDRTKFTFYAIVFLPFIILAIAYLANELRAHYQYASLVIAIGFSLIFLAFLYFFPLYVAEVITYQEWRSRMWFTSWI
jgi:dolichyl-phosphate-mannose-protein mannosyltransferase